MEQYANWLWVWMDGWAFVLHFRWFHLLGLVTSVDRSFGHLSGVRVHRVGPLLKIYVVRLVCERTRVYASQSMELSRLKSETFQNCHCSSLTKWTS